MNREIILKLADQLPTGRQDPKAASKFRAEQREFADEIAAGKRIDAATELADLVYYYCKMSMLQRLTHRAALQRACRDLGVSLDTAHALAVAKYSLRAMPGNRKNKPAEWRACQRVLEGE